MRYLVLLTFLTFVGLALVVYDGPSRTYWENVGPSWDKMFNPVNYND